MKQVLLVITGPSDIGKGAILDKLLELSTDFHRVVSHTDRPIREGEIAGNEYNFISEAEFTKKIEDEEFVEWQLVPSNGYRFGKTKNELENSLQSHPEKIVLTRINIINLPVFKRHYPFAKSLFIDLETNALIDYLKNSARIESEEEFDRRYKFATEERRRRHLADYTITRKEKDEDIIKEVLTFVERHRN